jgi:hypothetical protein
MSAHGHGPGSMLLQLERYQPGSQCASVRTTTTLRLVRVLQDFVRIAALIAVGVHGRHRDVVAA